MSELICTKPADAHCQNYGGRCQYAADRPKTEACSVELTSLLVCACGALVKVDRFRKLDHDGSYKWRVKCSEGCGRFSSDLMPTKAEALDNYHEQAN